MKQVDADEAVKQAQEAEDLAAAVMPEVVRTLSDLRAELISFADRVENIRLLIERRDNE